MPGGAAKPAGALITIIVCAFASLSFPALSTADTSRIEPLRKAPRSLVFDVAGVHPDAVQDAHVVFRGDRGKSRRQLEPGEFGSAPRGRLRVKKPASVRAGTLVVSYDDPTSSGDPSPEPAPSPSVPGSADESPPPALPGFGCGVLPTPPGCSELFADDATATDPATLWGKTDCAAAERQRVVGGGEGAYRQLTVIDGDDVWGERCELGRNDHRTGPTALFDEGESATTFASYRLPSNYPLEDPSWQVLMQMKQTQPSANGGGTPVISLEARSGRWRLMQSTSSGPSSDTRELWSAPAARGVWTRFALEVGYSQDPSIGSIRVLADLDGDGDASGAEEHSPLIQTYTLKRETEGGNATDGIAAGESIPSHLRVGIYHNPAIACPPPSGCSVEIDDVQIVETG